MKNDAIVCGIKDMKNETEDDLIDEMVEIARKLGTTSI